MRRPLEASLHFLPTLSPPQTFSVFSIVIIIASAIQTVLVLAFVFGGFFATLFVIISDISPVDVNDDVIWSLAYIPKVKVLLFSLRKIVRIITFFL